MGVPFAERVQTGPSSPPTYNWRATARNLTATRQTLHIWLTGINDVQNRMDGARRHLISPNGEVKITLGGISGAQPGVETIRNAITTTREG